MSTVHYKSIFAASILGLAAASCGDKAAQQREADARALYDEAVACVESNNPEKCIELLDSLNSAYHGVNSVLADGLKLRPRAIEMQCVRDIAATDSAIMESEQAIVDMRGLFTEAKLPGVGSYFVDTKAHNPGFTNTTGISARVSDIGEFYLVSSVVGSGALHHWSVSVSLPDGTSATTDTVPYDGEINYRINNSELISFSPAQSDTVGRFVAANATSPKMTLRFNGEKGASRSINLDRKTINAIANAYNYATMINRARSLSLERERLEARLATARRQMEQ